MGRGESKAMEQDPNLVDSPTSSPPRMWEASIGLGYIIGRFIKEVFRFVVLVALFMLYLLLTLILAMMVTILPREEHPWNSKPSDSRQP